jgi:hypothetical protein
MGFFLFLKYTFIIFAAHLANSCGAAFENHCLRFLWLELNVVIEYNAYHHYT